MARGDMLNREAFDPHTNPGGRRVVSLIGDASIVNGVAMEGLNNAGTLKRQFLVVLNDNGIFEVQGTDDADDITVALSSDSTKPTSSAFGALIHR